MPRDLKYSGTPPIVWLVSPVVKFARMDSAAGILLMVAAALAMILANSPLSEEYKEVLNTKIALGFPGLTLFGKSLLFEYPLYYWINDGLMAMFFFVVGLEIKREMLVGELATRAKASLPFAAAVGGMVIPALIYFAFNINHPESQRGWGVPMATDIAFAVGVLALVGKGVPTALKVFLMAVAIVDDIGAVLVIALFYTEKVNMAALGLGGAMLAAMILLNFLGVRRPLWYLIPGFILWGAFMISGVHATIAGVLAAFAIPVKVRLDQKEFVARASNLLGEFETAQRMDDDIVNNQMEQHALHNLELACEHVQPPLLRLEHAMYPWVIYFIMPIFALANAGVALGADMKEALTSSITLGIITGLVVGKTLGVAGATFIAVKLGITTLPSGVNWRQIIGVSLLAGIGFTMSLFIGSLAFETVEQENASKLGILIGSIIAGVLGLIFLKTSIPKPSRRH